MAKKTLNQTKYRFEQSTDSNIHKLYVYDNVTAQGKFNWDTWEYDNSETSANHFRDTLAQIPDSDKIELHVNSYGGEVKEGIAIYNLLKQHGAYKTCYVDGFAYSIASVIALACNKIIMGLGTSMLIHNMLMSVFGNAKDLRAAADDLDTLMESNRKIYLNRAKNITEEKLIELMEEEAILTPDQCLEYGLCDEIAETGANEDELKQSTEKRVLQIKQEMEQFKEMKQEFATFVAMQAEEPQEPQKEKKPEQNNYRKKAQQLVNAFFNN